MTVKQAAERLEISPGLVYALVASGKIRHERHGLGRGAIRITEEALEEYRRSVTMAAPASAARAEKQAAGGKRYRHLN